MSTEESWRPGEWPTDQIQFREETGEPQSELREKVYYQQPTSGIYYSKWRNQTQGTSKGTQNRKAIRNKTLDTQTQLTLNLLTDLKRRRRRLSFQHPESSVRSSPGPDPGDAGSWPSDAAVTSSALDKWPQMLWKPCPGRKATPSTTHSTLSHSVSATLHLSRCTRRVKGGESLLLKWGRKPRFPWQD